MYMYDCYSLVPYSYHDMTMTHGTLTPYLQSHCLP